MAALFWHSQRCGTDNVGSRKIAVENDLKQNGFEGVGRSDLDVFGGRSGVFLSIAHFPIGGHDFWEVVMGSGDDGNLTRNTVEEVAGRLRRIHSFD
jgi:hypothetical protein